MSARRTTDRPTGARLGNVIRATFTSTLDLVTSPGVASASLQVSEHAAAEVDRTAPRACCLPANFLCFAAVGVAERERVVSAARALRGIVNAVLDRHAVDIGQQILT